MRVITANGIAHHWREDGAAEGPAVVFGNSLGTDLRLWDEVLPLLPPGLRYLRYDMRGHGLTACPEGAYAMDDLISDAEALIEALAAGPVVFVGLSVGGMVGQGLAAKRPDLVRALVLSNTAAKMGTPEMWRARIAAIQTGGIAAMADPILERWFGPAFRDRPEALAYRAMLTRTPQAGYIGTCGAIAGADLTGATAALRLPAMGIAGAEDGASPPAQVEATVALIQGALCHTIDGAGHLPCVEAPETYAALLTDFLKDHAHA